MVFRRHQTIKMMDANQPNQPYRNAQQYQSLIPSQAMFPARNTNQHANATQPRQNHNIAQRTRPNRVEQLVHEGDSVLQSQPLWRAREAWNNLFSRHNDPDEIFVSDANRPVQILLENQRVNVGWGDELNEKPPTTTRLYAMNVNGLSLDARGGQFDTLCRVAKEVQADILCCQETNVDTSQPLVRNILYQTARQHWQRVRMVLGSTPTPFTSMYKPGGTIAVSMGNITGRLLTSEADKWGRWTSQTFRGQRGLKLTVISAYQVVRDAQGQGVITAALQQRSLLLLAQDPITDPRQAFKRDLTSYIHQCQSRGEELLLLGDFNEKLGDDPAGIESIAQGCGLINLMTTRHTTTPPATFARGRDCIDYGFGTHHVSQALLRCGYEAFRGAVNGSQPITGHISSILMTRNCLVLRLQVLHLRQTAFSSPTTRSK